MRREKTINGKWFDIDATENWNSSCGKNLYRTKKGTWIRESAGCYYIMKKSEAVQWFIEHRVEPPESCKKKFNKLEV